MAPAVTTSAEYSIDSDSGNGAQLGRKGDPQRERGVDPVSKKDHLTYSTAEALAEALAAEYGASPAR